MLQERRSEIIEKVKKYRMVKVAELMKEYGVSIETIRRDLEYLENAGFLKRVYGGAVLPGLYGLEPAFDDREIVNEKEKKAIGAKAAELIENGDTLMMDVGTTVLEVAQNLQQKRNLTVITNSTQVANKMILSDSCRVILLGGELRPGELSVSGFLAEQSLGHFYANKMIMGVGGITLASGVTDYHSAEANIRRKMLERSEQIIAVADCSKFGVTALNYICPVGQIHRLVTDDTTPQEHVHEYRAGGVEVIVAEKLADQ